MPDAAPAALETLLDRIATAEGERAAEETARAIAEAAGGARTVLLVLAPEGDALVPVATSDGSACPPPVPLGASRHPAVLAALSLSGLVGQEPGAPGPWAALPLPRPRTLLAPPVLSLAEAGARLPEGARLVAIAGGERRRRAGLSPYAVALVDLAGRVASLGEAAQVAAVVQTFAGLAGPILATTQRHAVATGGVGRAQQEFLSTVSHELRTPIHALLGFASLLLDDVYGPMDPRQRDKVARMQGAAQRLLTLVDNVLELARTESGRLPVRLERTPLEAVLHEAALPTIRLARDRGLAFDLALPDALPPVRTDGARLVQLLQHLLSNALKFTEQGGVTVRAVAEPATVRVEVADTGVGIAEEALASIWQDFTQVDASRTRQHGGTGLGLGIVRRLAEKLGATLDIASRPGEGTTVTVRLPRADVAG